MSCGSGVARVQNEILNYPRWAGKTYNAGCYNPDSELDGSGQKGPHARNPAEAGDIGIHPPYRGRSSYGQEIFGLLYAKRFQIGCVQLIWDAQIWSAGNHPNLIRPYTTNPHRDHIHFQLKKPFALNPATTILPITAAPTAPDEPVDEENMDRYIVKGPDRPEMVITADFVNARLLTHPDEVKHYVLTGLVPWGRVITWPQQWVDPLIARARSEAQ